MATKLYKFIRHYPQCKANQIPRYQLYRAIQPIFSLLRPFYTLYIDFILTIPILDPDRYKSIILITDKFSKAVTYLPGKSTWSGKD